MCDKQHADDAHISMHIFSKTMRSTATHVQNQTAIGCSSPYMRAILYIQYTQNFSVPFMNLTFARAQAADAAAFALTSSPDFLNSASRAV